MSVFITFIPWLSYWIFLSMGKIYEAVWVAFVTALFVELNEIFKKKPRILSIGTLVFFFLMALLITFTRPFWLWHEISLMGNLALALIALVSILIRKPFTLQYAMESTPKERWKTPEFLQANIVITRGWCVAFIMTSLPGAAGFIGINLPIWIHWAFSILCFIGATMFTNWYKDHLAKRK